VFLSDWKLAIEAKIEKDQNETPTTKMAKKVAKAVVKDLPDVMPMVEMSWSRWAPTTSKSR